MYVLLIVVATVITACGFVTQDETLETKELGDTLVATVITACGFVTLFQCQHNKILKIMLQQ